MAYTALIDHYGYIVLFVALMLELIIFGIPTEILMTYAGFQVYQGNLGWIPAILVSAIGSSIGISISYFIGKKLGYPFFNKYGHKVHIGPDRLEKFSGWFSKYGNALIVVAYFIPGIRHITGYFSGITKLYFRKFAIFAYLGAILWTSAFITLGKALGPQWKAFHHETKKYLIIGGLCLLIVLALFYLYRNLRGRFLKSLKTIVEKSPLRLQLSIAATTVSFIVLFVFFIGLVQDHLANETTQFNHISILVIHQILEPSSYLAMRLFSYLSNPWLLVSLALLTLLWILILKSDRIIELIFFVITIGGGALLIKGANLFFQYIHPHHSVVQGYPSSPFVSESFVMALIVWGFFAYITVQQENGFVLPSIATSFILLIALLLGISQIWLKAEVPSSTMTGYVFAGVWLSLNIVILDVFRELRRIQHSESHAS